MDGDSQMNAHGRMDPFPSTDADQQYDIAIVGGGVSGTSLLYTLSRYTDLDSIALLEQYDNIAPLNSDSASNSQTLHAGDIETNYSRAKSEKVKEAADMVVAYAQDQARDDIAHSLSKMVLGVGEDEVQQLEERYQDLNDLYPELDKLDRDGIAEHEPALVDGRDNDVKMLALQSDDGYAVDFGALSESFAEQAQQTDTTTDIMLDTAVETLETTDDGYRIRTGDEILEADAVAVTAGTNSL
ncbi:MAG: FAD-dependent oxidoreductase, partial [Candidatus Nanohaloarchaea archaeon]|nr:FAD-dependent oxidoreductase [Candidatus Nanohaloarchaea archaeon]